MRKQADTVIRSAIAAVLPDEAVRRALSGKEFPGRVILVAAGKAAWQMAKAASEVSRVDASIVITKYGHIMGQLPGIRCYEAGHPVPDENSFSATNAALALTANLQPTDTVLFLLSGGGSALFESPLVSGEELADITRQLLGCGADIVEMNTVRKRLSAVKGGKFALHCSPAQIYSIILSDILGDPLDMIASGPACADSSTCEQALSIADKYGLRLSPEVLTLLRVETPKALSNVTTCVSGSVRELCAAAAKACRELGYEPILLTDRLCCEAKEAGKYLANELKSRYGSGKRLALIAGGETVVKLTGAGKGGRNQELALAAAAEIEGLEGVCLFSVGSDGTDGPTDAAGGFVDGSTAEKLRAKGIDISEVLKNNDAYHALQAVDGLILTGPTGTNVNDVAVALING